MFDGMYSIQLLCSMVNKITVEWCYFAGGYRTYYRKLGELGRRGVIWTGCFSPFSSESVSQYFFTSFLVILSSVDTSRGASIPRIGKKPCLHYPWTSKLPQFMVYCNHSTPHILDTIACYKTYFIVLVSTFHCKCQFFAGTKYFLFALRLMY